MNFSLFFMIEFVSLWLKIICYESDKYIEISRT